MIRRCAWCKSEFEVPAHAYNSKYCSMCKSAAKREYERVLRQRVAGLPEGEHSFAQRKQLTPKECASCGVEFMGSSVRSKYCQPCRRLVRNHREHDRVMRKHAQVLKVYEKWREKNPDYMREWRTQNLEHCKHYGEEYRTTHPEVFEKSREKQRKRTDPFYKISRNLRARLHQRIKRFLNGVKVGSAIEELGCTVEDLIQYLETKFQPGMSWDNYGKDGWHIDHVKPLALFNLTDLEEFKQACHYTNLQPLWAKDNLEKGKRFDL